MRHIGRRLHRAAIAAIAVFGAGTATRAAEKVECHDAGGYFVVGREHIGSPGNDFLARRIAPDKIPACVYKQEADDFVIADKSKPYWFKDLRSDYLILTESTGPSENVVVFDLQTRRKVLDLTAGDLKVDDRGLYFWVRTEEASRKTCHAYDQIKAGGMTPMIETKARFIFAEARMVEIKARRCVGAQ